MLERQPGLIIFEGAQGSGKTSAASHLSKHGYHMLRGIPTGAVLINNRESTNWKESCLVLESAVSNGQRYALDRSLISLIAFNMRKKPSQADLIYGLGVSMLRRILIGKNYYVVVINVDATECIAREDKSSLLALDSTEETQKEIKTYASLLKRLRNNGFNVGSINNVGITREEFLRLVDQTLNRLN